MNVEECGKRDEKTKNSSDGSAKRIWKRPPGLLNRFSRLFSSTGPTPHYKSVFGPSVLPRVSFHLVLFIREISPLFLRQVKKISNIYGLSCSCSVRFKHRKTRIICARAPDKIVIFFRNVWAHEFLLRSK